MNKRITFLYSIWIEKLSYDIVTVEVIDRGYLKHYAFFLGISYQLVSA